MTFPPTTFLKTNGIRVATHALGSGQLVVLCHGFPELAYSWRHQLGPLADAGYHAVALDQRGYGESDCPPNVVDYDVLQLANDLIGVLDHYGHERAVFVGHDMGAIVVWNLAMLYPQRVAGIINLSVPFMERGSMDWISFWENRIGPDFYIVHYNRHPGVADASYASNPRNMLRNLLRKGQWKAPRAASRNARSILELANATDPPGELIMNEAELETLAQAFTKTSFTPALNWYRNFARNWDLIGGVPQKITQPTLMLYGGFDMVPPFARLGEFVPQLEVVTLDCGHWIQQELPDETNRVMLDWLRRCYPTR